MRTIAVVILALTASSVMSACTGPNFIGNAGGFVVKAAGAEETYATAWGVCDFTVGDSICCDQTMLTKFQTDAQTLATTLEGFAGARDTYIIARRGDVLAIKDSLNTLYDIIEGDNSAVSAYAQYITAFTGSVDAVTQDFAALVTNFDTYQTARQTCMNSLITAQVSIWCLGCTDAFADGVPASVGVTDATTGVVTLNDALITTLAGACYPYVSASATQSQIITLYNYRNVFSGLASGLQSLIDGDATNAATDLTAAVTAIAAVTNSATNAEKPSEIPSTCTSATSCAWIDTNLFSADGTTLVNAAAILGGEESIQSWTRRVLKGENESRRLSSATGYNPTLTDFDSGVTFAKNPADVDNTENSSAFRNSIIACAVAALALVF